MMDTDPTPYDHGRKAGNPGDLFKHAVLSHVVTSLARPGATFLYAETHAGPPSHRLQEGGEWERGVGLLDGRVEGTPSLLAYWRTALAGRPPRPGDRYPGSTLLARRLIADGGARPRLRLWDHNPEVCAALRRAHEEWAVVEEGDGYRGVGGLKRADLVLVDPIALDEEPVEGLLARLSERAIPFLCWLPRRGSEDGEIAASVAFRRRLEVGYTVESARWAAWGEGTRGCMMVASPLLEGRLREAAAAVRRVTGWES